MGMLIEILRGISLDNSMHIVQFNLFDPLIGWDPVQHCELFYANMRPGGGGGSKFWKF